MAWLSRARRCTATGKLVLDERPAKLEARRLNRAGLLLPGRLETVTPYPCYRCSGWHVGHPPDRLEQLVVGIVEGLRGL